MVNRFKLAEQSGRALFEKALQGSGITEYEFTKNMYDRVDVYFTAGTHQYCGEIKYRTYPSNTPFFQKGVVLEKHKYDDMKSIQNTSGYTPMYIHIFSDNICALFDLTNYEPTWVDEPNKFGRTTMGDTTKIRKAVCYIPLNQASNVSKIPL